MVDHAVRRNRADIGAFEFDRTGVRAQEPANRLHDGRFAGAVQSNQAGDGAGRNVDADATQDVDVGDVPGAHVPHGEKRAHVAASPRYASITPWFLSTPHFAAPPTTAPPP